MPTHGEVDPDAPSPSVTTDDFKAFQESLQSSVAKEMQQMREMIAQLLAKNGTPPPPPASPRLVSIRRVVTTRRGLRESR